jgi:hypothetical protein
MTELKQKQLAFLEETVNFYNSDNRTFEVDEEGNEFKCVYYMEGKPGCAIGRKIEDKELCKKLDSERAGTGVSNDHIFNQLPIQLKELGKDFLHKVQQLHDSGINWDEKGISEFGKLKVKDIKEYFRLTE